MRRRVAFALPAMAVSASPSPATRDVTSSPHGLKSQTPQSPCARFVSRSKRSSEAGMNFCRAALFALTTAASCLCQTYTIGTYAGGFTGDGGPASAAAFNTPIGVVFDRSGNLFVAEGLGH